MATKIIHKKSSVAASIPSAEDLAPGELALNLADQKIYSKTTAGTIIEMAPQGSGAAASTITETCKNVSGGSLAIGTPVYASGTAGNAIEVQAARADTAGAMPAIGILAGTLADEAEGTLVLTGFIQGVNTSSFSEGDTLYVAATGGLTATPPAGSGNLIQNIGKVVKVHLNNGSIMVTGAGRANATPNLDDGDIFIGNSSNQATTASLTTEVQNIGDSRYVNVTGDTMTGDLALSGADVTFGDNDKAIFGTGGASSQLQIYSDGTHSYIKDSGAGSMFLRSASNIYIQNAGGTANYFKGTDGGASELFHNGSPKLATTSTGIDVTGTVTADGLTVGDGTTGDHTIDLNGAGSSTSTTRIHFQGGGTGNPSTLLSHSASSKDFTISTGNLDAENTRFEVANNGDISFYEDTGTTPKFHWSASAESLGIGTSSPAKSIEIRGGARIAESTGAVLDITPSTTGTNGVELKSTYYADGYGPITFNTGNTANRMVIDSSGNLLVGTTDTLAYNAGTRIAQQSLVVTSTSTTATDYVGYFNRQSSDGKILQFGKANSSVGSIGTNGGDLTIGTGDTGIRFIDSLDCLLPLNTSTNATRDAAIDIGYNDGGRFKDLHLSGTVNANSVDLGSFVVTETNGHLYFSVNGVNKMKLDSSGNLQVVGNVDSNATIT